MPPENTNPVAKTEPSEFEFEAPQPSNLRIKKRNLKAQPSAPNPAINPASRPAVYAQPASATHSAPIEQRPAYTRPSGTEERPQPAPATGVLYYSSASTTPRRPEAMKAPLSPSQATRLASGAAQAASHSLPQRTASAQAAAQQRAATASAPAQTRPASSYSQRPASTPQAAPTRPASTTHTPVSTQPTSHSTTASSAARPASSTGAPRPASSAAAAAATQQVSRAVSTHVAGPSTAPRPAGVSDYRANIDRQSREQKSVGNILNILVYGLVAVLVCGGMLAAYGAHDVYKQLHAQSTTVTELDARYSAANQQLTEALKANTQTEQQIQAQLAKAQELILRQEDALAKLQASLDAQAEALRQERSTRAAETSIRAQETSALRSRLRALEAKNEPYRP